MLNFYTSPSKYLRHLCVATSVLVLTACATATPYQPASEPGGYDGFSQQLIENDRARISFGGNSLTDRATVENYLLYRAAEMAVERGYKTFTLQERDVEQKSRTQIRPGFGGARGFDRYFGYSFYRPSFGWSRPYAFSRFGGFRSARSYDRFGFGRSGFGRRGFYNGYNDPFFNDFDVREVTKYRATAEVKFGRAFGAESDQTFNAREVLQNLSGTINFPDDKS